MFKEKTNPTPCNFEKLCIFAVIKQFKNYDRPFEYFVYFRNNFNHK